MNEKQHTNSRIQQMDKYTAALRRLHIGAGFIAGSGLAWIVSEIISEAPLVFYFAMGSLGVFAAVALVDAWRTR